MRLPDEPTGTVSTPEGTVAYWCVGVPGGVPLVCLHGGPAMPHPYLEPLAALATDRLVVFYDQSGCGRTDRRPPGGAWSVEYAVDELALVVAALGLDELHLFGNSWGGWLALEYALGEPAATVHSLSLNSTSPSVASWLDGVHELRARLPGGDDSLKTFNRQHMCRLRPWPDALKKAIGGFGEEAYAGLWGAGEFGPVDGALRDYDIRPRLPSVRSPTLVTCGRHDEATPERVSEVADGIPGARFRVFEDSSHMAFLEEPDAFTAEHAAFLTEVERDLERTRHE